MIKMTVHKSKRGGARIGAGRKPIYPESRTEIVSIRVSPQVKECVRKFQKYNPALLSDYFEEELTALARVYGWSGKGTR